MFDFRKKVESKWGKFIDEDQYYIKQCNLAVYSPRTFLNVLFKPVPEDNYKRIKNLGGYDIPKELKKFYKSYNGIMLFSQTLRIYGVSVENLSSSYSTLDFVVENTMVRKNNPSWDDNMVSFGYYGSRYRFCYHRKKMKEIYVIDRNTLKVVHTFKSISDTLEYYVTKLMDMYDENGMKIGKDKNEKDTPLMNISMEEI